MSLELSNITQLRGIAQSVGLKVDWKWTRLQLIEKIQNKTRTVIAPPEKSDIPNDDRLRSVPPAKNLTQVQIFDELKPYRDRGMLVLFPQPDTVRLLWPMPGKKPGQVIRKEDSLNIRTTLWVIMEAAKRLADG